MSAVEICWCVSGRIEQGHLITNDGETIKIRNGETLSAQMESRTWKCIPLTDSTGDVTSVSLVEELSQSTPSYCVGRVTQLGKRSDTVLVKVSPSRKITFHSSYKLVVGGIYKLYFEYQQGGLHIVAADRVDEVSAPTQAEIKPIVATKTILSIEQSWQQKLEPLIYAQFPNFHLISQKCINGVLEWEGVVEERKIRIQGTVGSTTLSIHEFAKPDSHVEDTEDTQVDCLKVTPLGAARSIGASCFKVEIGNYEVVLDAGTRPKGDQPLPAFEHLRNPNLILITHAHSDHIGALPVLHSMYPETPMICTPGTREIAQVMLSDCLKVQQRNEDFQPIFDEIDLKETLFHLETQPIGVEFEPLSGLKVKFINAGHIVGAACIYLKAGNRSLLYTGDYNIANSRTTEGLQVIDLPTADILITEATYGASIHPNRKHQETELVQAVLDVVENKGNVLIPAFALGRAQEIILSLKTNAEFSQSNIPIYVDGLVKSITDVYSANLKLLPKTVQNLAKACRKPPFCDDEKVIAITDPEQRQNAIAKPSVIIASSGMLTGGPSVYYAQALIERENAAIFISGYTDEESPGRLLQEMQTGETVTIDGKDYTVKAQIRKFNLSAHTDRVGIGQVIAKVQPRHLILVHGSSSALHDLARTDLQKHYIIHIPHLGDTIEYGVLPQFISLSTKTELPYLKEIELEIVAEHDGAWIRIPKEVVDNDPHWQTLAAMGSIRATWHHSSLVLKPVTLESLAIEKAKKTLKDCCAKCQFLEDKLCACPESPLYKQKIDPEGICPEFIKI